MNKLYQQTKPQFNAQAAINQLLQRNPDLRPLYDLAIKSKNPRDMFFNAAKQKGIDPNTILSQIPQCR